MSHPDTAITICETCGTKLPARTPLGMCPRCLLGEATVHDQDSSEDHADPELVTDDHIENYSILRKLGEGGFGVVYEAEQLAPVTRRVALKVLKPGMDSLQIMARFGAERQALALLEHPFIAKVYDAGETERGRPYFAMELVQGSPLTEYCKEHGLTLPQRLELFGRVCQGVQHAHQKGIIHRDLKPGNILVEGSLETLELDRSSTSLRSLPRIIDFGIARATEQLLTEATLITNSAQVLGTPGYMSPEQAAMNCEAIDTRSDVYALGAILYELLTGTLPFSREELQDTPFDEVLRRIREDDPPKPSLRAGSHSLQGSERIPPDLNWITLKALRKNPADRYSSVAELAADIERFLNDEPISARPPSALYVVRKFIARHKTATATVVATGLALLAGTIVSTMLYLRAEENAARAEHSEQNEKRSFSRSDFLGSEQRLQNGQSAEAVAQLVRAIRTDPKNTAAKFKLLTTLAYTDFIQPTHPPQKDQLRPYAITMSADSSHFAICTEDGKVSVRETRSGHLLRILEHKAWVTAISFHPTETNYFLTSSRDRTAVLWDLSTGDRLQVFQHRGTVEWSAFTPDGARVITHATDGTACVWETTTGRRIATMPHGETRDGEYAAALAPDGRSVVLATGNSARIWSLETFEPVGNPMEHDYWIHEIVIHPRGLIATGSRGGTARVWELKTSNPLTSPLRHPSAVITLAFSPDGSQLLTGTIKPDNAARIWDINLQQAVLPPMRHGETVYKVLYSPNGRRVITAGYTDRPNDAAIQVWQAETAKPASAPIYLSRGVRHAALTNDGSRLVTTSRDGYVRLWDLRSRAAQPLILRHRARIWLATFTPDSQALAIWTQRRFPKLWNVATGMPAQGRPLAESCGWPGRNLTGGHAKMGRHDLHVSELLPPELCEGVPLSFAFTADGKTLLTGGHDGILRFWDFTTKTQMRTPVQFGAPIGALAVSDDDTMIVAGTAGNVASSGSVHWLGMDGSARGSVPGIGSSVYEIAIPPNNSTPIAAGYRNGAVRLISTNDGGEEIFKQHTDRIHGLTFSLDGRWLASGSADNTAIVWDVEKKALHHHLTGHIDHTSYGLYVAFSPDGRYLVTTGSHDETTRVWEISTGEQVAPAMRSDNTVQDIAISPRHGFIAVGHPGRILDPHTGEPLMHELEIGEHLSSISFSPDERRVVAGGWNGTAMAWDLPPCEMDFPEWFLEFAEAFVGRRYGRDGLPQSIDSEELEAARKRVLNRSPNDELTRWAKWLAANPTPRKPASPWMSATRKELADHLASQGTAASLRRALELSPDHPRALAILAWRFTHEKPGEARSLQAQYYSKRATELAPRDAEVWKLRAETLRRIGQEAEAAQAQKEAERLQGGIKAGAAEFLRRARELFRAEKKE